MKYASITSATFASESSPGSRDSAMTVSTQAATMPSVTVSNYAPFTKWRIRYEAFLGELDDLGGCVVSQHRRPQGVGVGRADLDDGRARGLGGGSRRRWGTPAMRPRSTAAIAPPSWFATKA